MTKNVLKVGDSVVFNRVDGSSQSAKVTRAESREVQITYRTAPNNLVNEWVQDLSRLTKFAPGSMFMVTK